MFNEIYAGNRLKSNQVSENVCSCHTELVSESLTYCFYEMLKQVQHAKCL